MNKYPLATNSERAALEAVDSGLSRREAGEKLGISRQAIEQAIKRYNRRVSIHDNEDSLVRGTSTLYDSDGNEKLKWVKTKLKDTAYETVLRELAKSLAEDVKPIPEVKPPRASARDILAVYPIGDLHLGMYAWADEAGAGWNTRKAAKVMLEGAKEIVNRTAPAHSCVIANLGDFFHTDNMKNRTRSGHALDVDGKQKEILKVGVDLLVSIVRLALKKHNSVRLVNEVGNHDELTSYALSLMLEQTFKQNKRVEVDLSPKPYHKIRFGSNLIGIHHGHLMTPDALYRLMAEEWAEDWAETVFRFWYTGHIHHLSRKEVGSMEVESFRTIIPKDAYHSGHGYQSKRDLTSILLHKDYGETQRHIVNIRFIDKMRALNAKSKGAKR